MLRITSDFVVTCNLVICKIFNQTQVILDLNKIKSALSILDFDYDDDFTKSAKVFRNLIIAHGFQDGNKRTACLCLLIMNKPACSNKELENIALDVANGRYTKDIGDLVFRLYNKNLTEDYDKIMNTERLAQILNKIAEKSDDYTLYRSDEVRQEVLNACNELVTFFDDEHLDITSVPDISKEELGKYGVDLYSLSNYVDFENLEDIVDKVFFDDEGYVDSIKQRYFDEALELPSKEREFTGIPVVDLIRQAYDTGRFNNLKCVGRDNACTFDIHGPDKERIISFFDKKDEFNREDHNDSGVNSVEFISDKFDIEIFDDFIRIYKIPQNEAIDKTFSFDKNQFINLITKGLIDKGYNEDEANNIANARLDMFDENEELVSPIEDIVNSQIDLTVSPDIYRELNNKLDESVETVDNEFHFDFGTTLCDGAEYLGHVIVKSKYKLTNEQAEEIALNYMQDKHSDVDVDVMYHTVRPKDGDIITVDENGKVIKESKETGYKEYYYDFTGPDNDKSNYICHVTVRVPKDTSIGTADEIALDYAQDKYGSNNIGDMYSSKKPNKGADVIDETGKLINESLNEAILKPDSIMQWAVAILYDMDNYVLDVYDNEEWLVYGVPDGEFEETTRQEVKDNYTDHDWLISGFDGNFDADKFKEFLDTFKSSTSDKSDYDDIRGRQAIIDEAEQLLKDVNKTESLNEDLEEFIDDIDDISGYNITSNMTQYKIDKIFNELSSDIKTLVKCENIDDVKNSEFNIYNCTSIIERYVEKGLSFGDAVDKMLSLLFNTKESWKKDLERIKDKSRKSDNLYNKIRDELGKEYPVITELEGVINFKAPENATQNDCIKFTDKVVKLVDGKYHGTGRGGSWTIWDILTSDGVFIRAGWGLNDSEFQVQFPSRRLDFIKESFDEYEISSIAPYSDSKHNDNDKLFGCDNCGVEFWADPETFDYCCPNCHEHHGEVFMFDDEDLNESIDSDLHVYLFPKLTSEDKRRLKAYNLKYLGANHGAYGDENNDAVEGTLSDLESYAKNYLAYELHPDYLYAKDDFAGDIIEESVNSDGDLSVYDTAVIKIPDNKNYDGRVGTVDYIDDEVVTVKFKDGLKPEMNNFDHNQVKKLTLIKQEDYIKNYCNNEYKVWLDKIKNHDVYRYIEKEDAYHDYKYYVDYNNELIIVDIYYIGESNKIVKENIIRVDDYDTAVSLIDDLGFNGALAAHNDFNENGYIAYITGDETTLRQFIDQYNQDIGELDLKIEEFKESINEDVVYTEPIKGSIVKGDIGSIKFNVINANKGWISIEGGYEDDKYGYISIHGRTAFTDMFNDLRDVEITFVASSTQTTPYTTSAYNETIKSARAAWIQDVIDIVKDNYIKLIDDVKKQLDEKGVIKSIKPSKENSHKSTSSKLTKDKYQSADEDEYKYYKVEIFNDYGGPEDGIVMNRYISYKKAKSIEDLERQLRNANVDGWNILGEVSKEEYDKTHLDDDFFFDFEESFKSGDKYYGGLPAEPSTEEYADAVAELDARKKKFITDNNIKVEKDGNDMIYSGEYNGHTFKYVETTEFFSHWVKSLMIDDKEVNIHKSTLGYWPGILSGTNKGSLYDVIDILRNIDKLDPIEDKDYIVFKYDESIEESFVSTTMPSISDLKSFFNTSDTLRAKYSNFFEWFDDMVKSGKFRMSDLRNESCDKISESVDVNIDDIERRFLNGELEIVSVDEEDYGKYNFISDDNFINIGSVDLSQGTGNVIRTYYYDVNTDKVYAYTDY